jgi:glycosyltransferase involved in cell wall biosynthesis
MKRIGIVVTNLAGSGAERVALSQAHLFQQNGYEVVLFMLEDIKNYDTSAFQFPIISLTKRKDTYKFLGKNGDLIYAQLLQAKMDQFGKFDIVLSNLPRADRVVKLLKNQDKYFVIHISYKAELEKFSPFRAKRKLKLYKYLYRNEKVITVSKGIIKDFKDLGIEYKEAISIYNLFDFEGIRCKAEEKIPFTFEYILAPSAFREQKRYDILLDAFSQLRTDIKLVVLANSDPKLDRMIEERNLKGKVIVLGFQKNPYPYMKNAKLTVMSSDYEGFGMVIVESLIVGTPVVSTDCPTGPNEILTNELSQWLVPVNNSSALAKTIDKALQTKIKISDKDIQKFEQNTILHEYQKLFDKPDRHNKYKKVAIVVTNLASSGAEKIALSQAKLFKEYGHEVVLFLVDNVKEYDTEECDFPIETLTSGKNTYKVLGKVGDRIYAEILHKKMQQYGGFDVVISNLPRADRVVKLLNHPNKYFVIHTSYKTELEKFASRRGQKKSKLYQYLYANENIITVANAIIHDFDHLNIKYHKAITIYNPFSFESIRAKGAEKIDLDFDYIISPSAFRKEKRYDVMLDALKLLKSSVKLVILANSDPRLDEMIKERGLEDRVVILKFQQNPYKYIKNAKLLVLSSEREGLPTVMIESLILGTPVVATDCPTGPSEILTGELSRWLVPLEDPKALAEKIDEALESKIEIDENILNKFDKETIYQQFKALL